MHENKHPCAHAALFLMLRFALYVWDTKGGPAVLQSGAIDDGYRKRCEEQTSSMKSTKRRPAVIKSSDHNKGYKKDYERHERHYEGHVRRTLCVHSSPLLLKLYPLQSAVFAVPQYVHCARGS
jgi:hypothetical protein